jgi:hypothetical protein
MAAFHESNDFRDLAKYTLEELDVREWISLKRRQEYGNAWPYTLVAATVGIVEIDDSKCWTVLFSCNIIQCYSHATLFPSTP